MPFDALLHPAFEVSTRFKSAFPIIALVRLEAFEGFEHEGFTVA